MMCLLIHFTAKRLFSFDITKRNTLNDRRSLTTECNIGKNYCLICVTILLSMILILSSRYLINVSQIPEDALKQRRLQTV